MSTPSQNPSAPSPGGQNQPSHISVREDITIHETEFAKAKIHHEVSHPEGAEKAAKRATVKKIPGSELLEGLPEAVLILDSRQREKYANSAFCDLFEKGVEEAGGAESWLIGMVPRGDEESTVLASWREHIWRKQLTRTYTLSPRVGKVVDLEFQPALQEDGSLTILIRDVTLLRKNEESLRQGKLKFRALFGNTRQGVVLADNTGRVLDANQSFIESTGIKLFDLRLSMLREILHPTDAEKLERVEEKIRSKDQIRMTDATSMEVFVRGADSERKQILTFCPVATSEGEYSMGIYLFQEVGFEKSPEAMANKLRELASRAQALLSAVPELVLLIGRDGVITDFAPPPRPWRELSVDNQWIGDGLGRHWPTLNELFEKTSDKVFTEEKTIRADLPGPASGSGMFSITFAPCGEGKGMIVVANSTNLYRYKRDAVWQAEFLQRSSDAVLVADGKGFIFDVNPAAAKLFGKTRGQLDGRSLASVYQGADDLKDSINLAISRGKSFEQKISLVSVDDENEGSADQFDALFLPVQIEDECIAVLNFLRTKQPSSQYSLVEDSRNNRAMHRMRDQLQMVTSLFSLEDQSQESRRTSQKWQVRLRAISHSIPFGEDNVVWIVPMLRTLADEVSSIAGRGPGRREIVITGPEELSIRSDITGAFCLLCAEIMRMVILNPYKGSGPKLFLDLEECAHGEIALIAKPGKSGRLFSPSQEGEAGALELLAQQIRGRIRSSLDVDDIGGLQVIFDGN